MLLCGYEILLLLISPLLLPFLDIVPALVLSWAARMSIHDHRKVGPQDITAHESLNNIYTGTYEVTDVLVVLFWSV